MSSRDDEIASPGLLVVRSEAPLGLQEEYHHWYDSEHVAARIRLAGWLTARRYVSVDNNEKFLAYYDLQDLAILSAPEYVNMRTQRPDNEKSILEKLPPLDRRVYRNLEPNHIETRSSVAGLDVCGEFLLCVWWQPNPESVDEFHKWYDQEHIPMLSKVPGWLRSRRFELVEGNGPTFLAMHDVANLACFDQPEYLNATSTPLRELVTSHRVGFERILYKLLRRFDDVD